jgi:endoglucanase
MKMKNKSIQLLFFFLGVFLSISSYAENVKGFLRQSETRIINDDGNVILRGMEPGGWMLQEGYMFGPINVGGTQYNIRKTLEDLTDKATTDAFYENWLDHFFTREDVDSVASWGYNSIRVPLHYNLFTLPIEDESKAGDITWLTKGFEMVDSLLAQCEDNDLYLILDLHAAPGGQGKNAEISDYDPSKPSLWESSYNQDKFVALWYELAKRYKDNVHIGGYDLLNETNWWDDFDNNAPLVNLFKRTIDTIRTVDNKHIIILEGNSWANDYNGFDGISDYDTNLAFGPHKYWNSNDQGTKDWLNNLRKDYKVPVWLGETGENSNTWLTDMVTLMESINVGWATWAYKQMDIDDPLGIQADQWHVISDYMNNGGTKPSYAVAKSAMDQMSESIKTQNCDFRPDVVFAQINLPQGAKRKAYKEHKLPGTIFATDYDMGKYSDAWYDMTYQDLHGDHDKDYTAWNNGYMYRNDGIDIQECKDQTSNGYHVGWTEDGEWMRYSLSNVKAGTYDVTIRVAATSTGKINIRIDNALISPDAHIETPNTGGYQSWWDVKIKGVSIPADAKLMTIFIIEGGYNLNSVKFDLTTTAVQGVEIEKKLKTNIFCTDGLLHVELEHDQDAPLTIDSIDIYDLQGSILAHQGAFTLHQEKRHFSFHNLSLGLCLVKLTSHKETVVKKVLIC